MSDVKRYMAIRMLDDDGETERPCHFRVVAASDYAALAAQLAEAKADVCKFLRWYEESKNHLRISNERLAEAEAALRAVLNVDKATPGRKDCHIWADMLECARAYFAPDSAPDGENASE